MSERTLSTQTVVSYLDGLDLPATRQEIVECARRNGAPDAVVRVLQAVPDRRYRQMDDVMDAIGQEI
ncbi:MAG: DUF2795 domain-containing protein [Chloroflexi bacterium]|nr:DUF2795 domain-containing protein [Chloroflexota bacterium]